MRKKPANRAPSKAVQIGDLLGKSVNRIGIRQQVTVANVISAAKVYFDEILTPIQKNDIRPGYVKKGILTIYCLNGPASRFVGQRSEQLLNQVKRQVPDSDVEEVRTKIVDHFPSSEL